MCGRLFNTELSGLLLNSGTATVVAFARTLARKVLPEVSALVVHSFSSSCQAIQDLRQRRLPTLEAPSAVSTRQTPAVCIMNSWGVPEIDTPLVVRLLRQHRTRWKQWSAGKTPVIMLGHILVTDAL